MTKRYTIPCEEANGVLTLSCPICGETGMHTSGLFECFGCQTFYDVRVKRSTEAKRFTAELVVVDMESP